MQEPLRVNTESMQEPMRVKTESMQKPMRRVAYTVGALTGARLGCVQVVAVVMINHSHRHQNRLAQQVTDPWRHVIYLQVYVPSVGLKLDTAITIRGLHMVDGQAIQKHEKGTSCQYFMFRCKQMHSREINSLREAILPKLPSQESNSSHLFERLE